MRPFDLSIVIVAFNSASHIEPCLASIRDTAGSVHAEVIVIDNSPGDETAQLVASHWPDVHLRHNRDNPGFSRAANHGLAASSGAVVAFLNPDTVVLPGAFERLLNYLRDHPRVGVVGPRVWDDLDHTHVQLSCRSFPTFRTALFNRYSLLTRLFPNNPWSARYLLSDWQHDQPRRVDWVSGCCMAVRRSTIDQLGGFDERFWMYAEDVDLCYRALKAGWEVHYLPHAEIVHRIGGSSASNARRALVERHRSMWRYYRKHHRLPWPLDLGVRLAIAGRCGVQLLGAHAWAG